MRWTPGGTSEDIEDRRDEGGGDDGGGPVFGGFGPHLGIGGTIVLLVLSFVLKQNFFTSVSPGPSREYRDPAPSASSDPAEKKEVQFVSFVLDDVQRTWEKLLPQEG